jgi:hypothetical protein
MGIHEVTKYKRSQNPVGRIQISAQYDYFGYIIHSPVRIKYIISQSQQTRNGRRLLKGWTFQRATAKKRDDSVLGYNGILWIF